MRKVLAGIVLAACLVIAASAQADVTQQISGFYCSVTSHTPWKVGSGAVQFETTVSCGGLQYSYDKDAQVCLQVRGADGYSWFTISGTCGDGGWIIGQGTVGVAGIYLGGVVGHVYRGASIGQIRHNGVIGGADTVSQGFMLT